MSRQLLRPYAFDVDLPLDLLSIGQCHMHQDDPIPAHRQVKTSTVLALLALSGFAKYRGHARVRHIPFQFESSAGYRPRRSISRLKIQGHRTGLKRLRKDLRFDDQTVRLPRSRMTSGQSQQSSRGENYDRSSACYSDWGFHAHEQLLCCVSPSGGNMW